MTHHSPAPSTPNSLPPGVSLRTELTAPHSKILRHQALALVADLEREFRKRRAELLQRREQRQREFDGGARPNFLPETRHVREGDWSVAPAPADLVDRRVEITGPPDRKMVINALNTRARVFMSDFEDSCCPTWENLLQGQIKPNMEQGGIWLEKHLYRIYNTHNVYMAACIYSVCKKSRHGWACAGMRG